MNDRHYEKMSEAELSKKLGQYQKQARIWTIIGLVGVLGGVISFFAVVIAVAFAAYLAMWVKRQNLGNARIEQIGKLIRDGANTFMRREYKLLACFAGVVAVLILIFLPRPFWSEGANFLDNVKMVIAYVAGTVM